MLSQVLLTYLTASYYQISKTILAQIQSLFLIIVSEASKEIIRIDWWITTSTD